MILIRHKITVYHVSIVNNGTLEGRVIPVDNATDHVTPVNHETRVDQPTTEDHVILVNLATEHVTLAHNEILVERATADHETLVGHETDHIQPENQVDIETI